MTSNQIRRPLRSELSKFVSMTGNCMLDSTLICKNGALVEDRAIYIMELSIYEDY